MRSRLINPLNIERDRMRTSIAVNLLDAARHNERFGAPGQRIFEMGNVFHYEAEMQQLGHVTEQTEIGMLIAGAQEAKTPYNADATNADIFLLKGLTDSVAARAGLPHVSYQSASVSYFDGDECLDAFVGEKKIGTLGKIASKIGKEFDLRSAVWSRCSIISQYTNWHERRNSRRRM